MGPSGLRQTLSFGLIPEITQSWYYQTMDIILAPIFSLCSINFYKRVLHLPLWKGFLYLFYLSFISASLVGFAFKSQAIPQLNTFVNWLFPQIPPITFTPQGISSSVEQPYRIAHPSYGTLFIMDTSRDSIALENLEKAYLFLTRTKIYIREKENEVRVIDLKGAFSSSAQGKIEKEKREFTLSSNFLSKLYKKILNWVVPLVVIAAWAFIFVWKLCAALVYSLLALVMNQFKGEKLKYPSLLNLCFFALTPVLVLQMVRFFIPFGLSLGFLGFLLTGCYLALALYGLPSVTPPTDQTVEGAKS